MPNYFILITLENNKRVAGLKEHNSHQIEAVYKYFEKKYKAHYGSKMIAYECVMVSKQSEIYRVYFEKKRLKILGPENTWDEVMEEPLPGVEFVTEIEPNRPGKYRSKKEKGPDKQWTPHKYEED